MMTYDERLEIGEYLDIVKKNCERLLRSIDMMQDALGKIKCSNEKSNHDIYQNKSAKEKFLENY